MDQKSESSKKELTKFTPNPTFAEYDKRKEFAQIAVVSGLTALKSWQEAFVVIQKGHELGIPPMQALTHINVILGKIAIAPELMLALIYDRVPGSKIEFIERSDKACRIMVHRPGEKAEEWSFTWESAAKLKLTSKDNYQKQPATMLQWRCIGQMARAKFPDALMGCSYTPEELGAVVNEEGEVIDIPSAGPSPVLPEKPLDSSIQEIEAEISDHPKEYVFDFGMYNNRTFRDINPVELAGYYDKMKNKYNNRSDKYDAFYAAYEAYTGKADPKDEPPVQSGDELIDGWDEIGKR